MKTLQNILCMLSLTCLLAVGAIVNAGSAEAAGPNPAVVFETNIGRIIVMLYPKEAPVTVENFLRYVDEGFYDGTIFHRVVNVEDFKTIAGQRNELPYSMIQGGGYDASMRMKRTHAPIINEGSRALLNKRGTIAMARKADPDSATAQFFINVEDNSVFDYKMEKLERRFETKEDEYKTTNGYCAFGKVIRGMEIVDKISQVKRQKVGPHENVPVEPVIIKRAYRPR